MVFFSNFLDWNRLDACPDKSNIVNDMVTINGSVHSCPSDFTRTDYWIEDAGYKVSKNYQHFSHRMLNMELKDICYKKSDYRVL